MKNSYQKTGGVSKQDRLLPKPEDAAVSLGREDTRLERFVQPRKATIIRFLGTHPGETDGPPWWAKRKLFEALRPSFCDLVSEHVDGVKNLIPKSETRLCKGLVYKYVLGTTTCCEIFRQSNELKRREKPLC
jgi:hypothetical protein